MAASAKRWIGWLVALLATLIVSPAAIAMPGGTAIPLCVLPATPGMSAPELFVAPARFDCTTPQRDFGAGDFWLMSAPLPAGDYDTIRMSSVWQERVTLYVLHADGTILRRGFTSATMGRYIRLGVRVELDLPPHPSPPVRLLWHVEGASNQRGIVLGAAIATRADGYRTDLGLATFYAGFAGLLGGLLVYHLALLVALRQPFQAAYCVMLTCLLAYGVSTSGVLSWLLPGLDNNIRLRLNAILLAASAAAVMTFARLFFERRVFAGWLGTASTVMCSALLGSAMLFVVAAPHRVVLLDRLMLASHILLMLLVPAVLWQAWRQRSNYLWVFAIAWGLPIAASGLRILHGLGWIRWQFWLDQSTVLSMGIEALLSSIGIAYRLRLIQQQRDAARERELLARALADIDPLTGLLNRRAFLHQAIGRSGQQTLLIADLDHFKAVNETIGHDGGDEVLRCFARALQDAVPEGALVARFGGEEFAVVAGVDTGMVPGTILQTLRATRMPFDMAVTTSIGTCTGPLARETDWKMLYRQADRALFAAKAAGRDRARDAATMPCAA